jgi:hypothetical protein
MWSGSTATLNWATDRLATTGYATYGLAGDRLYRYRDLNSGEVHTDVLDAPPTSTSRVEGLSRLGSVGGTTIFNGPSFVLTTKIPYVASPESWVTALIDYFNPLVGMQWTSPPSPQNPRNLICYFSQLPAERSCSPSRWRRSRRTRGATCRWGGSLTSLEGDLKTRTWSATRSRAL